MQIKEEIFNTYFFDNEKYRSCISQMIDSYKSKNLLQRDAKINNVLQSYFCPMIDSDKI